MRGRKNNNYHKPTVLLSFSFCFSLSSNSCATIFLLTYYCSDSRVTHTTIRSIVYLSVYQLLSRYQLLLFETQWNRREQNKSFSDIFSSRHLPTHPINQSINQSIHHGDHNNNNNNNTSQCGLAKPPSRKRPLHHQYRLISLRRHLFFGYRRRSTIATTPPRKTRIETLRTHHP